MHAAVVLLLISRLPARLARGLAAAAAALLSAALLLPVARFLAAALAERLLSPLRLSGSAKRLILVVITRAIRSSVALLTLGASPLAGTNSVAKRETRACSSLPPSQLFS